MSPHWTLFFAAVCGLAHCGLVGLVIAQRRRTGILVSHGDNDRLRRRLRAQGNFSENVPLALLLMLLLELSGLATPWLLVMGIALLLGRALHATALLCDRLPVLRVAGTVLTVNVISLGALACLLRWWSQA